MLAMEEERFAAERRRRIARDEFGLIFIHMILGCGAAPYLKTEGPVMRRLSLCLFRHYSQSSPLCCTSSLNWLTGSNIQKFCCGRPILPSVISCLRICDMNLSRSASFVSFQQ